MEELFKKALGWYKGLKTWKKVVGFLFLIVLAVLGIVYAVYKILRSRTQPVVPIEVDIAHNAVVNNVVKTNKDNQMKLEAELMIKKADAAVLIKQRVKDAEAQKDIHSKINSAKSFEEVDAILKGMKR